MTIRSKPPLRPKSRDDVIRQWLLEQVRKGNLPKTSVGAGVPVFVNAVMTQEGPDIVIKCCVVGGSNFYPIVTRINMPAFAKMLQERGLMAPGDSVSGLFSKLKKTVSKVARAVTHNKVIDVIQKVADNPVAQIVMPGLALNAHTVAKAAGKKGAGGLAGAAFDMINKGTMSVVAPVVAEKAMTALAVAAKAVDAAKTAKVIADTARKAQAVIEEGKKAAAAFGASFAAASKAAELIKANTAKAKVTATVLATAKTAATKQKAALALTTLNKQKATAAAALITANAKKAAAAAAVKKAADTKAAVVKNAAALAAKAAQSRKVQASIAAIAAKAKAGSAEAKAAAAAIVAAAKMTDKISAANQAAAGGHAGFVVSANGVIRRAPKGRFIQSSSLPLIETLYRGATAAPLRGSFTAVSGRHSLDIGPAWGTLFTDANVGASPGSIEHTPQWGGARDPGDEYEGPLYPARYNDPGAWPTYMADPHHTPNPVITPPIPEPGFPPLPDVVSGYGWPRIGTYFSGVASPTSSRTEVRSPTRTSTEVRSPTRTATEVRSPTSTSTDAYTQGNFTATVTGGAGAGATTVHIHAAPQPYTLDSRGRKQLAKTAMDVDTSFPASDSSVPSVAGNTRNFLGLVAGNPKHFQGFVAGDDRRHFQGFVAGDAHGWGLGTVVSGPGHWPLPSGPAEARKKVKAQMNLAVAKHLLKKARERTKVGKMASLMVGRSSVSVGEDIPPELTESSDGLSDVDMIVQGADYRDVDMIVQGQNHQDMHDVDMIVQGLGLKDADLLVQGGIGCAEPGIAGYPSYLFTRGRLHPAVVHRRFVAYLKSLPPKMRRRVGKRMRAAMLRTRIAGAIRGGYPAVGSHYGWTGVMGGIPGGYELVGSHRQPGILTP